MFAQIKATNKRTPFSFCMVCIIYFMLLKRNKKRRALRGKQTDELPLPAVALAKAGNSAGNPPPLKLRWIKTNSSASNPSFFYFWLYTNSLKHALHACRLLRYS